MKLFTPFFFAAGLLIVFTAEAQQEIVKIGLSAGGDIEMPHPLSYQYLLSTAEDVDFNYEDLPFEKGEITKMNCDNPTFRIQAAFSPEKIKNAEWQISMLHIDGRIDEVVYDQPEDGQHLKVSATNKETAIEAVLLTKTPMGKSFILYAGGGSNIGYSHEGKVRVKGFLRNIAFSSGDPADIPVEGQEIDREYDQSGSINQRLFLQAGLGLRFLKRMEFGLEYRRGFGYRATFDGPFNFTTLKRSLGFSLKYSLM